MRAYETVAVPATPDGVRRAADAFEAFGTSQQVPPETRWRFLVAIDEALSHIVRQGYRGERGLISLAFALDPDVLSVGIVDSAPMFNPLLPTEPAPEGGGARHEDGAAIVLVRALMDDVRYEWKGRQNHLTIVRRLRREPAGT